MFSYQYDNIGRLTAVLISGQIQVSYEYYLDGRRKKMTDENGITEYTYNAVNGLIETITRTPNGGTARTITYHYNDRNLIDLVTYPDGKTEAYTYDSRGLLDTAKFTNDAAVLDLAYDANGRIDSEVLPNGISVDYAYDDAGRLTGITNGAIAKSIYTLAPNGNRDTMETNEGTTAYQYDDQNRLISAVYPDGSQADYTYDAAGNRISLSGSAIDVDALPVGTVNYTYDDMDRLISYTDENKTIEYQYDGDGSLCEKTVCDATGLIIAQSQYFYDYSSGLPRILVEYDVVNSITIDYTYAGRLYGKYDSTSMYYYHQDGLGSILAITDANGAAKNTYAYDAFGEVKDKNETVSNSILFTGELVDEAGNVYIRARFYDPTIGRFLTKDTYTGNINNPQSLNLYTYCYNNPVNRIDPSGHDSAVQVNMDVTGNYWGNGSSMQTERSADFASVINWYINYQAKSEAESDQIMMQGALERTKLMLKGHENDPDYDTQLEYFALIEYEAFKNSMSMVEGLYGGTKVTRLTEEAAGKAIIKSELRFLTRQELNKLELQVLLGKDLKFASKCEAQDFIKAKFSNFSEETAGSRSAQGWHYDNHSINGSADSIEHINLYSKELGFRIHITWGE